MSWEYGAGTHVGNIRQRNEDHYHADPEAGIWVVADGMGGRQAGDVASGIIADFIPSALREGSSVLDAVAHSHQAVINVLAEGKGAAGMGSTAVVLQLKGNHYEIGWVGDSRAYLWNGDLLPLTRDHTVVQRLVEAGALSPEDARDHPHRSSLLQALGSTEIVGVDVEVTQGTLKPGEQILLCSDGLTSEVKDDEIAAILEQPLDVQGKVDRLIQAALNNGGKDNVTVLLITAQNGPLPMDQNDPLRTDTIERAIPSQQPREPDHKMSSTAATGLWLMILLSVTLGAALLVRWLSSVN
ncbi:MAG: serine/threonine-protein phosphatase [Gammaproteobacteria bacterium]|nr:serine/threonine-protein phosphatase [Gammaproteobacteria bacterium]MCP5425626.1 serine/threonine-protein phosphatase [Gammaproteobacteria bacterium]MCP5458976.1 serine/threonine-protein phosphatase [Gammaproteobacteria bacterium]